MTELESRDGNGATPGEPRSGEPECGENQKKTALDLYWLAFLLTGDREASIDIAVDVEPSEPDGNPFFAGWIRAWSRRLVIAKALSAIREELGESRRAIDKARVSQAPAPDAGYSPRITKARIEEALLGIDAFPRAALLLSLIEGIDLHDVATLLDADIALVKKARTVGLQALTTRLMRPAKRPGLSGTATFVPATS